MNETPPVYHKLTRMRRGIGVMTQLWLGPDHLLQVQSTGYTETYQRFYLRDIQALLLVHGDRRLYIGMTLGVLGLIAASIAASFDASWPAYAVIGGILLLLLLWNHLLGSGCRVLVITAVQKEKIPSLSRLPKTRRVLAELKPLIEVAQADLVMPVPAAVAAQGEPPLVAPVIRREPPVLPPPLPVP